MRTYTDSWAVYRGLTSRLLRWQQDDWQVARQPLRGQDLRKDIYEHSLEKVVTLYHVNGHQPFHSPGNAEANNLARIRWLEEAPAEDTGKWLHRKMHHEVLGTGLPGSGLKQCQWGCSPVLEPAVPGVG